MGIKTNQDPRAALATLGITGHDFDMRVRYQECFACRAPMNFMRLYVERKLYCKDCETKTGAVNEAIDFLNDY
ncbi:MAG: hypothetical protein AAFU79_30775 [Myxococcota bacterium]